MKIFAFNRIPGAPITSLHDIELYPDSAPVASGKPVFLPEISTGFAAVFAPAFRVSRLGKDIAAKFAPRYYDAVAAVARVYPLNSPVTPGIARPDMVKAFDGALILGPWQPVDPESDAPMTFATGTGIDVNLTRTDLDINASIATVSALSTLKMGDIVIPCYLPHPLPLEIGTNAAACINGDRASQLIVKIK